MYIVYIITFKLFPRNIRFHISVKLFTLVHERMLIILITGKY